jgi:hypothetical protein
MLFAMEQATPIASQVLFGEHLVLVRRVCRPMERVHRRERPDRTLPDVVDVLRLPALSEWRAIEGKSASLRWVVR